MDNIVFYSNQVYMAEQTNPDSYIAKFVICDFNRNNNGTALDRDTIENWMGTIRHKPLVGKIKMKYDGTYDFSGHNMKVYERTDEDGNKYKEYEFDTDAFGSFIDISIETINDEFAEALSQDILSQGLDIENQAKEENDLKKTDVTQVAEENVENTVVETPVAETTDITTESDVTENNETTEVSQLTEWDLREKIGKPCKAKLDKWCWIAYHFPVEKEVWLETEGRESALDYVRMTYSVENDVVTVSEPEDVKLTVSIAEVNDKISNLENDIASKDDAIIKAGEEIANLKTEISQLTPFKEKFEIAEQERIEAEMNAKKETIIASITKSGLITKEEIESSEELKGFVDALDEKSLKAVLADRYIASLSENTTEISETKNETETASTNLDGLEDEQVNVKSIMKNYFGK